MTTQIKKIASLTLTLLLATAASAAHNDTSNEINANGNNGNHYGQIKKAEAAWASVPEPATLALLGAGAAALGYSVLRRRRRK